MSTPTKDVCPHTEHLFDAGDEQTLAIVAGCISSDLNSGRRIVVCGTMNTLMALKPHLEKISMAKVVGPSFHAHNTSSSAIPAMISAAHYPETNILLMVNTRPNLEGFAIFGYNTYYPVSVNFTGGDCLQLLGRFLRVSAFGSDGPPFRVRVLYDDADESNTETARWLAHVLDTLAPVTQVKRSLRAALTEPTPVQD